MLGGLDFLCLGRMRLHQIPWFAGRPEAMQTVPFLSSFKVHKATVEDRPSLVMEERSPGNT